MAKEGNDLFDGVFHAKKIMECRITAQRTIAKQPQHPRVDARIHGQWLANRGHHPLGGRCIGQRVLAAEPEPFFDGNRFAAARFKLGSEGVEQGCSHGSPRVGTHTTDAVAWAPAIPIVRLSRIGRCHRRFEGTLRPTIGIGLILVHARIGSSAHRTD